MRRAEDRDNYVWIRDAGKNRLVVGSQARILYQDAQGRMRIALAFNAMVRNKQVGPIMLGRNPGPLVRRVGGEAAVDEGQTAAT